MARFPRFALLVGFVTIVCTCWGKGDDWPFTDALPTVLASLATRVDRCVDSLKVPLVDTNSKVIESCACPVPAREIDCHAGNHFVAFAGKGLPKRGSWSASQAGASEFGLAYVPDGRGHWTEFSLHGFATLDPRPTRLGYSWYLVSICWACD